MNNCASVDIQVIGNLIITCNKLFFHELKVNEHQIEELSETCVALNNIK